MQTRNRILVELVLQSGAYHHFEITEEILNDLEEFRRTGLSPRDLCRTWLQVASWDAPACLRVVGKRADGTDVLIELSCNDEVSDTLKTRAAAS